MNTRLLPWLAVGAVFTFSAISASAQAVPGRIARHRPRAATPIVQQSPNGLYRLSITDDGIELAGPAGGVKITAKGIEVGAPNTPVAIKASNIEVTADKTVTLLGGTTIDLNGSSSIQMKAGEAGLLRLDGGGGTLAGPKVTLGCDNGRPAARAGDAVDTSGPPVVAQGSSTVLISSY